MNDCTTCRWNRDSHDTCLQGHSRDPNPTADPGAKRIQPYSYISDCHAWKEKCECWNWGFGVSYELFDITCKKCGRKVKVK